MSTIVSESLDERLATRVALEREARGQPVAEVGDPVGGGARHDQENRSADPDESVRRGRRIPWSRRVLVSPAFR
jgi:hypothetical protein